MRVVYFNFIFSFPLLIHQLVTAKAQMPLYSDIYHNTYHRGAAVESDREMGNSSWWIVDKRKRKRGRERKESKKKERERKGGERTNCPFS